MYHREPPTKPESPNRPIRMLPYGLAVALGALLVLSVMGFDGIWVYVSATISGGWTLGRMTRR